MFQTCGLSAFPARLWSGSSGKHGPQSKDDVTAYRIHGWSEVFEKNRTRELKTMIWVAMPTKHDSDGFTELMDHVNGTAHYGAWCLMVQVAAKSRPRGTLMRDCGTSHNPESLSRLTRAPASVFKAAIPRLVSIGWLEVYDNPAGIPQASRRHPAPSCGLPAATGEESTGEEKREQNKKGADAPVLPDVLDTDAFRAAWGEWVKHRILIKKPLAATVTAVKMQIKMLEKMGHDRAIATIEHTVASGAWIGLVEPRVRGDGHSQPRAGRKAPAGHHERIVPNRLN